MPKYVRSVARTFALMGALTMIIGLVAASAASAATQVPVWSSNGSRLPFGSETSFSGTAVSGLNLKWTLSGAQFWIQCNTLSASGTVENYAYSRAGTLKPSAGSKFTGCRVAQVGEEYAINNTPCSVPAEIPVEYSSGELTNTPYSSGGLKLSKISLSFKISNCPEHLYESITWKFTGSPTGNEGHGAWPGEILFPEGTPLTVNSGGSGAEAEFGLKVQAAGFTPIKVTEEELTEPSNPGHHYWYTGGAGLIRGEGAQTLVAAGSPLTVKGSGVKSNIVIEGALSGVKTTISCAEGTTAGSVENPAGGADGTASLTLGFSGCNVLKPEGKSCYVKGGGFSSEPLSGTLATAETPVLKLTAPGALAKITIAGCTLTSLNNWFPLSGSLLVSPTLNLERRGSWAIPNSQTELKFGGNKASASGLIGAETTSGEAVTWAG